MTITALQKQERQFYLGASDSAAIVGLDPYRTAVNVFLAKGENAQDDDFDEDNLNILLGNALEPIIGQLAGKELEQKTFRFNKTLIHPEWDFIAANLDYTVGRSFPLIPIECKLTNNFMALNEPLPQHIPQILQQMACSGAPYGYLAYIVDGRGRKFKIHKIERDEEAIEGLIGLLCDFWFGHVLTGIAPPVTRTSDLALLYSRAKTIDSVVVENEVFQAARLLRNVKEQIKGLEKQEEEYSLIVKTAIGDHEGATFGEGKPFVTWKNNKDKVEINWKGVADTLAGKVTELAGKITEEKIEVDFPSIWEANTTTKEGARVMRLQANILEPKEETANV